MKRLFSIVLGFAALIAACFQKMLGERLMSAMVADGPVAAIGVCRHAAPEITAAIARHGPDDQATGLSIGDLRGAFVVAWPAASGGNRS
ncbi:MAG: hypothetical protein WBN85_10245 [Candidatus Macondimonas sp.]